MISVKTWFMVLVFYLVAVCTILSHGAASGDLSFLSGFDKRDTPGVAGHLDHLGVTGAQLVRLFKKNLVSIISHQGSDDEEVRVSRLYDAFRSYLFDSPKSAGCSPHMSVVAKLTKDVDPLPVHSHNDYWRSLPLLEAIAYGASSVEADVWIVPDVNDPREVALAVAHNEAYIDPVHQTLDKLYTSPLMEMLDQVNCRDSSSRNGVFFDSPEQTLYFYIDFKSPDSRLLYRLLMQRYLKPLIEKDYLTYYDMEEKKIVWRQITVILTGDFPNDLGVIDEDLKRGYFRDSKRYVFLEASIVALDSMIPNTAVVSSSSFSQLLEKCHSSQLKVIWRGHLVGQEINCLKSMIYSSHELNVQTRIWGVPNWPQKTSRTLWGQIIKDLHSDILNVDDLREAAHFF